VAIPETQEEQRSEEVIIMGKLEGKVAVITGGSSGIGWATAKRFVEEGAHVVITGRREKELREAAASINTNVTAVLGDVSRLEDLDRLYAIVKEKHGHIDILFANAGAGTIAPLAMATESHFDQTFDVNVKGMFFTVQKALPLFNDGGSIILNSSVSNVKGLTGFTGCPQLCTRLDDGAGGPQDSGELPEPRRHRDSGPRDDDGPHP
jgi:NAD(P)-dependent dehydrogenase (short-subunit alcohol dehydrogenase family)